MFGDYRYTNKTIHVDWSCDFAERENTTEGVELEKSSQIDVAVFGAEHDVSEEKGRNDDISASSRFDFDETKSFTNHSMVYEGQQNVDWSELASARAEMQSSSDSASSRSEQEDEDWQSLASDDEEPELCNLLGLAINSSMETTASKLSDDNEKYTGMREDEVCECNDQPQDAQEMNNFIITDNGTFEEVCLSSSTYYFACSGQNDDRDDSRMQAADDGQYSCSCCASSCADKWTTVEEDDGDNKAKSPSAESRASVDSTANWYQQQIVTRHGKHAAATGDLDHHSPAMTPSQQQDLQPADTGFNCHSTAVAEARSDMDPANDNSDDRRNVSSAEQRQDGEACAAGEWQQLEYSAEQDDELMGCNQFLVHADDGQRLSVMDDAHSCCADCSGGGGGAGGCYDDEMYYINYEHRRHHHPTAPNVVVDVAVDAAPTLTGVQVCGPASYELLFLIDQLASSACFIDDPGAFMSTVMQTAPPTSAYVDYSNTPRITELHTDDENDRQTVGQWIANQNAASSITGRTDGSHSTGGDDEAERQTVGQWLNQTAASDFSTTGRTDGPLSAGRDDELLNRDADDFTTPAACGAVEEDAKKASLTTADCADKRSETRGDDRGQVRRRNKRSDGQLQTEKATHDAAETHAHSSESLRGGRQCVPVSRGNVNNSGQAINKDNEQTAATTGTAKSVKRFHATAAGRQQQHQQQRHRLPPVDAQTSTMHSNAAATTTLGGVGLTSSPLADTTVDSQRDKHKLPVVFVERKPPPVPAGVSKRPGTLRLPPVHASSSGHTQRREAARVFAPPPPPQRRRSHPLARRRPMTPANRNIITSRAVWPSMASGRPVEDEWTRRAAVMRRRPLGRLPPLYQHTASVAAANWD